MTQSKEFNYAEAMAEIEQIIATLGSDTLSVDELEKSVKRASELIKACQAKLDKVEQGVEQLLNEE